MDVQTAIGINANYSCNNIQSFTNDRLGRPSEGMTLIVTASEAAGSGCPDAAAIAKNEGDCSKNFKNAN